MKRSIVRAIRYCIDCGKRLGTYEGIPTKFDHSTGYVCNRCYYGAVSATAPRGYNPFTHYSARCPKTGRVFIVSKNLVVGSLVKCPWCQKRHKVMGRVRPNPAGLYQAFHGKPPAHVREVNLAIPKPGEKLVAIGKLVEIIYAPYGSSGHKGSWFSHKAGDLGNRKLPSNTILASDQSGKNLFLVKAKESRFPHMSARGIIG